LFNYNDINKQKPYHGNSSSHFGDKSYVRFRQQAVERRKKTEQVSNDLKPEVKTKM
jgi:hypothetical protein